MPVYICGQCGAEQNAPYTVRPFHCGTQMTKRSTKLAIRRSDSQRRSREQEKKAAKRLGMDQQPASGALPGAKSDLRKRGERRAEMKETTAKSFSLKLAELQKLERESHLGERPLFLIEFQCVSPPKRYAVVPEWVLEGLIAEKEE